MTIKLLTPNSHAQESDEFGDGAGALEKMPFLPKLHITTTYQTLVTKNIGTTHKFINKIKQREECLYLLENIQEP